MRQAETQAERQRQFHQCLLISIQCFLCPTHTLPVLCPGSLSLLSEQKLALDVLSLVSETETLFFLFLTEQKTL